MSENLLNLVNTIRERKNKDKDKSYTSSLLSSGLSKCIDKMEEEFGELKEALNDKSNEVHEAADTIYHLLVTLEAANIKFEDVARDLDIQGETIESVKLFDMCVKNLFKQSDDAGDYLRMIVENFEGITD